MCICWNPNGVPLFVKTTNEHAFLALVVLDVHSWPVLDLIASLPSSQFIFLERPSPNHVLEVRKNTHGLAISYMGGCQNHGAFLGPYCNMEPSIQGTPKGAIIWTTTYIQSPHCIGTWTLWVRVQADAQNTGSPRAVDLRRPILGP